MSKEQSSLKLQNIRTKILLYAINGMYWVTTVFYISYMSAYYREKGLSAPQIGIMYIVNPLTALLVQPLWARISDRTGRRRRVLTGLSVISAVCVLFYTRADTFGEIFATSILFYFFNCAILPLCDALVIDQARIAKTHFSHVRMSGTVCYALVAILSSRYLGADIEKMFRLGSVSLILFTLLCLGLPKDIPASGRSVSKGHIGSILDIFDTRAVLGIFVFEFAIYFGLQFAVSFNGVFLLELGCDSSILGIVSCISASCQIPVLLCADKLYKRFGARKLMMLASASIILCLALASIGNVWMLITGQMLQSLAYMLCYYVCTRYVSLHVRDGKISQAQSMVVLIGTGLGSIGSALAGSSLVKAFDLKMAYFIMSLIVSAIAVANILSGIKKCNRQKVGLDLKD
jgi:oligosaccharide:H+ symporter